MWFERRTTIVCTSTFICLTVLSYFATFYSIWNKYEKVSSVLYSNSNQSPQKFTQQQNLNVPDKHQACNQSLITLFTTIKDREVRREIHKRTLKNWASLMPCIVPVLFVPVTEMSSGWYKEAARNGWKVEILPEKHLRENVPIIRDMFLNIKANLSTPFAGFANADILFDQSLITTLKYIYTYGWNLDQDLMLITGRRKNAI